MPYFMLKSFSHKLFSIGLFMIVSFSAYAIFAFFKQEKMVLDFSSTPKKITISDNGLFFLENANANTVGELLEEKKIKLSDHDRTIPEKAAPIYPGINIEIKRAVKIKIQVDGKTLENYTLAKSVSEAIHENDVILSRLDKTLPDINAPIQNNSVITVTRINVEERTEQEEIDFKTIAKLDDKLGWREKNVTTPGEKGIKEVKYKITYKNGKEVSRIVLSKTTAKEPVTQVETQGTYVKCGKANKGQGTWYAFKGGMFAASTTIPKGSYARVTNTANGKTIIVQINDYGPQGKGRIIDLDKVAFAKIASLGAGVIGVKVEEVLN